MKMPENEKHRFLEWQDKVEDCRSWEIHLAARNIPHALAKRRKGWTIYKHMVTTKNGREKWCCDEGKKLDETKHHRSDYGWNIVAGIP